MFPKSMLLMFAFITLIVSGGSVFSVATNDNMSTTDKALEVGLTALNTPNSVDDFCAKSIKTYDSTTDDNTNDNTPLEDTEGVNKILKKYSLAMVIISLIGIVLIVRFLVSLVKWIIGFAKPPASEERLDLLAWAIALILFGALTGYSFVLTTLEVV